MRILVLSDIHANGPALAAVVGAVAGMWDEAICLGDVVGYGAHPDLAVRWVRDHAAISIRGNHDRACATGQDLERFQPVATEAARWTHAHLAPESLAWLATRPRGPIEWRGMGLAHGSPLDEDRYLLDSSEARRTFETTRWSLQWCGHTHVQGGYTWLRQRIRAVTAVPAGQFSRRFPLESGVRYLLNPGSVGQPRDGDGRAAFAIHDASAAAVEFYRVVYPVAAAQAAMVAAGLPPALVSRLSRGR